MSYQSMFSFAFQNLSGLTLNAKLFDSSGSQTGATITSGFADLGDGAYQYLATIPDGHVGTLKIYDSAQPSRCIPLAVNPQEIENADVKTSTRSTFAGGAVASVTGDVGGNVVGSIGSLATQAKADVNAEADTALSDAGVTTTITGRIDAAITTRASQTSVDALNDLSTGDIDARLAAYGTATATNVSDTQTTITDAIGALNDITAADVVTAIMAYAVESGKDYATVLKEVYAILRGKFVADNADPASVTYYAPDGTTERVTFTLDDTTRTPS